MSSVMAEAAGDYESRLASAREEFGRFLDGLDRAARVVVLHDSDADGVTAGVVLRRALERAGFRDVSRLAPDRERNAWAEGNRARVRALQPRALFVLDLGSAAEPIVEGVPTCLVDHHQPEGVPPGALLLSGYGWRPAPNTSLLAYELCRAACDVEDLEWVAAIGTISDLGERAPFELVARAKKRHKAKWLKEATTLVNAARRASAYDPERAARALLAHAGPRELVESESEDVAALRAAREEVAGAMAEAKKAAPVFSGRVALLRVSSPCQVHPLVAQIWRTRLPGYVVIAANDGYLPGRVNFSARAGPDTNVLDFLRAVDIGEGEGNYGHGHDQASGGSLPLARWNEFLRRLGFPESATVKED